MNSTDDAISYVSTLPIDKN